MNIDSANSEIPFRISRCVEAGIYAAALHREYFAAYGFIIGNWEKQRIDFALPVKPTNSYRSLDQAFRQLDASKTAAEEVARFAECELVGAFLAEETVLDSEHVFAGLFVRYVRSRDLMCVLECPTSGGETILTLTVFTADDFPAQHRCRSTGRRSSAPQHNPRRVKALWMQLLSSVEEERM